MEENKIKKYKLNRFAICVLLLFSLVALFLLAFLIFLSVNNLLIIIIGLSDLYLFFLVYKAFSSKYKYIAIDENKSILILKKKNDEIIEIPFDKIKRISRAKTTLYNFSDFISIKNIQTIDGEIYTIPLSGYSFESGMNDALRRYKNSLYANENNELPFLE